MMRMVQVDQSTKDTGAKRRAKARGAESQLVHFPQNQPLELDCGTPLSPFCLAYQTYEELVYA